MRGNDADDGTGVGAYRTRRHSDALTLGIIAQKLGILNVFSYGAIFPLISLLVYFTKVRGQIKDLGI